MSTTKMTTYHHYREDLAKGSIQPMKPVMMEMYTRPYHYREDLTKGGHQLMKSVMMSAHTRPHLLLG